MTKFNNEQLEARSLLAGVGNAEELDTSDSWLSWTGWAVKEAVKFGASAVVATAAARSVVKAINFDSVLSKSDGKEIDPMNNPALMTPVVGDEEFSGEELSGGCPWEPKGNGAMRDEIDSDSEITSSIGSGFFQKISSIYTSYTSHVDSSYAGEGANSVDFTHNELLEPVLEDQPLRLLIMYGSDWQSVALAQSVTGAVKTQSMIGSALGSATSAVRSFTQEQYENFKDGFLSEKDYSASVKEVAIEAVDTTADLAEELTESDEASSDWSTRAAIGIAGHAIVNKVLPSVGVFDNNVSSSLFNGVAQHAAGAYTFGNAFLSTYEQLDQLEAKISQNGLWASVKDWASTPLQTINTVADAAGMSSGTLIVAGAAAVTIGAPVFAAGSGLLATMGLAAANMYIVSQTFGDLSEKIDQDFEEFAKTGDEYIASGIETAFTLATQTNDALVTAKSYLQKGLAQFNSSTTALIGAGLMVGNLVKLV